MYLNTIKPTAGSKKVGKRLGRGIGSGKGKTSGRGHKGQHARSGGYHKVGFEGGQMPLQRRLPKFGFTSLTAPHNAEVRLGDLDKIDASEIDLLTLYEYGLVPSSVRKAKIIATGKITKAVTLRGIEVTKGALALIQAAGGKVVE